jgi:predicted nuclease of predicted toxin-antitoxin system
VKILLDHNLDWRISDHLAGHEVRTALEMAWDTLKNGALLMEAEKSGFSVLITSDKGIRDQQTMKGRSIAVVILRAGHSAGSSRRDLSPRHEALARSDCTALM